MTDASYSGPPPLVGPGGYGLPPGQGAGITPSYLQTMDRPSSEWGKDDLHLARARDYPGVDPSPYMPRPGMFNQIMGSVGRVPWSMRGTQNGTSMLYYWNAYYKQMRQNKLDAARMSIEQAKLAQEKFAFENSKEMSEAHDILSEYGARKPELKSPDAFRHAWDTYLRNHSDPTLQRILDNAANPYTAAEHLFKLRDTTLLNVNKAISQNGKTFDDPYGGSDDDTGDGGAAAPTAPAPTAPPAKTAAAEPDTAAPAAKPTAPAAPAATGGYTPVESASSPDSDTNVGVSLQNDRQRDLAHDIISNGFSFPARIPAKITAMPGAQRAMQYAQAVKQKMQQIAANKNLTPQQVVDQIGALDSGTGEALRGLVNVDQGFNEMGRASQSMAYRQLLTNLARRVRPGWSEALWQSKQEYMKSAMNAAGKEQTLIQAGNTMVGSTGAVMAALKEVNRWGQPIPQNFVQTVESTMFFGNRPQDEALARLGAAVRAYAMDMSRFLNQGGSAVRTWESVLNTMGINESPGSIINAMQADQESVVASLNGYNNRWKRISGQSTNIGSWDDDAMDYFKAFGAINPHTNVLDPKKIPKGVTIPPGLRSTTNAPLPPPRPGFVYQRDQANGQIIIRNQKTGAWKPTGQWRPSDWRGDDE